VTCGDSSAQFCLELSKLHEVKTHRAYLGGALFDRQRLGEVGLESDRYPVRLVVHHG